MAISWKNNRLGRKIFEFGLGMFLVFSVLIYFLIYGGIPVLYKYYKTVNFEKKVNYVLKNSEDLTTLNRNLELLREETNVNISYEYQGINYNCLIDGHCQEFNEDIFRKTPRFERDDFITRQEKLEINGEDLTINFTLPISSTKEVQNILFLFLPIFGLISVTMALLLSYAISTRLSKAIVSLRNDAKKITSLMFDIDQSVKSNDELGDLSHSLVVLANTLCLTLNDLQEANAKLHDDMEKERLREEERRAYIATLSHDLKTPLTAIRGQLEGMLYNVGKYKDHETYLEKNIDLTYEMEEMIQTIIISSKLDEYNLELVKQDINLLDCLKKSLLDFDYSIENKALDITMKVASDYIIKADSNLFGRVLNNLISNAIEYSQENSKIDIILSDDILSISNIVADFDDSLISEELIYKPFYRQDKSRNKNGSGLGMYIVKKICDLHGIKINLEYNDNKFIVYLSFTRE
ncbi:HAMP domain-containing histidine kinase [Erysipelotrichaceae bacterium OttesenSCG-928-M19]|nr:HAMP domain-containing histidine kinase [Erysipelotrichaceae bacterium OttesenSCG-928-M19]